jgi:hypothetical protein
MNITYPSLHRHEKLFRRWSGLSISEFDALFRQFEPAWHRAEVERLQGRTRQRALGGGGDYQLDLDTRLLMLLIWLRHYLTGETLGYLFGVNQSTVSRNVSRLLPVLQAITQESLSPPNPQGSRRSLLQFRQQEPDLFAILDATEQNVYRPQDDQLARSHYSGKQRRSTCKNAILVNEEGLIRQITPSSPGSLHDMTHVRQAGILAHIPPGVIAVADAGFMGLYKDLRKHSVLVPHKAYRKHPLLPDQRFANRELSAVRIKVENVFAQLKTFRILTHRFRHNVALIHSQVFAIIAGLHNRRLLLRLKLAWLAA